MLNQALSAADMDRISVFCLRGETNNEPEWKVAIDGKIIPAEWHSKGAAKAGAMTELRRMKRKEMGI